MGWEWRDLLRLIARQIVFFVDHLSRVPFPREGSSPPVLAKADQSGHGLTQVNHGRHRRDAEEAQRRTMEEKNTLEDPFPHSTFRSISTTSSKQVPSSHQQCDVNYREICRDR